MTEQKEQTMEATETPTEETSSQPSEETSVETEILEEPDFAAITEFVEAGGEIIDPPAVVTAEEETPPAEETPPEETPAVEASESEEPTEEEPAPVAEEAAVETKEETPSVEAAPEPEPEPVKYPTAEELEGLYTEHREKTLPQLEQMFVLTEEDAAALDEAPSKIIPKLAGRMMYDTMLSTYNAVITALPTVVAAQIVAGKEAESAQAAFYDAWPDLNNPKARPVVSAAVHAYRAANPRAGLEEVIKQSGVMAMLNLGLDPTQKKTETKPKPPAPKRKPARPAGAGNTAPTPPVTGNEKPANVFSELAELYDSEHS